MENFIAVLLGSGLRASIPLMLAALGESYNEKAGLLNLGIEGVLLGGAFSGFVVTLSTGNVFLGFVAGVAFGIVSGLLFAYLSVTLKLDQIITGIGFTIFMTGITSFLFRFFYGRSFPTLGVSERTLKIPFLSQIPVIGPMLFDQHVVLYMALLLVPLFHWVLFHSTFGLNIKAVGEAPVAADAAGISVSKTRYFVAIIAGAMAGLGGAFLAIGDLSFFVPGMTRGVGYIAIAMAMLGKWSPYRVFIGAWIFGLIQSLSVAFQIIQIPVRSEFILMMPYIGVIIALVFLARNAKLPATLMIPYKRGER